MRAETPTEQNELQPKTTLEWQLIASKGRTYLWSENTDTTHVAAIPGG